MKNLAGRTPERYTAGTVISTCFIFSILVVSLITAGCAPALKYNVVEKTDFSINYDRGDVERWLQPYYDFPDRHEEYRSIITESEFMKDVNEALETDFPKPAAMDRGQLKDLVLDGLNTRFMVEGINKRQLVVTAIGQTDRGDYTEKRLLLNDEHVGTFGAMLLMPDRPKPVPAIVGLHGHADNYDVFADKYMGRELAKNGFAVIMPDFRAMKCDPVEVDVTTHLAINGFNLMGMRVYEALLLVEYLKYLDEVDNTRIGLLSHSGGSSTANLVVRISDDISAQVMDLFSDYMNVVRPPCGVHCEVLLDIYPLQQLINDLETLPFPSRKVPYGFDDQEVKGLRASVLDFFVEHLYKDAL